MTATSIDATTVEQLLETYAQAWADHDPKAIARLHTQDSVFHTHIGMPPVTGRAAIEASCAETFATYRDFSSTPGRLHLGVSHWVLEWTMTALMVDANDPTTPARPIRVDCVDIVSLSPEGLVARKDVYMDVEHVTAVLSGG